MSTIGDLKSWEEVSQILFTDEMAKKDSPCLLIGNGASIAVSEEFDYNSLYDKAIQSVEGKALLSGEGKKLFEELKTTNFEAVLRALRGAEVVNNILSVSCTEVSSLRAEVQNALAVSVGKVHINYFEFNPNERLKDEYVKHKVVFSTNYDLLLYWSVRKFELTESKSVIDLFWSGGEFKPEKSWLEDSTRLYYLHGGLHLELDRNRQCRKRKSEQGNRLLDQYRSHEKLPDHIVTEGTWQEKKSFIDKSIYLTHAFEQLVHEQNDLVIFGFSFDMESDKHIVDAIRKSKDRTLAISVHRGSGDPVEQMDCLRSKLSGHHGKLLFFDAATHPLGAKGQFEDPLSVFKIETGNTAE